MRAQDTASILQERRLYLLLTRSLCRSDPIWTLREALAAGVDLVRTTAPARLAKQRMTELRLAFSLLLSLPPINCLARRAATRPRSSGKARSERGPKITYRELHAEVCKFANVLKATASRRATASHLPADDPRAGGRHAGLRAHRRDPLDRVRRLLADSLADRINDSDLQGAHHRRRPCAAARSPLKDNADEAIEKARPASRRCVVVRGRRRDGSTWRTAATSGITTCGRRQPPTAPEEMDAEDPLFILYTSGSTGKPKGVQHTTGGYLVYAALTTSTSSTTRTATSTGAPPTSAGSPGHSYIVYGPLANGATTLMFEGVPRPTRRGRFWQVVRQVQGHAVLHRAPPRSAR
jgi:acetyl-CoA synthetase